MALEQGVYNHNCGDGREYVEMCIRDRIITGGSIMKQILTAAPKTEKSQWLEKNLTQ